MQYRTVAESSLLLDSSLLTDYQIGYSESLEYNCGRFVAWYFLQ